MSFHLGKPILVMLILAAFSGSWIALQKDPKPADIVLWTFAESHAKAYSSIIEQFERQTGRSVAIEQLSSRALGLRLQSMFMSGQSSRILPDLVEIEIGQIGPFFLPPLDQIGLLPLNSYLRAGDWDERIVASRFAPWSKQGTIFGVPHDVHPVTITYRHDLFDQAGIDLEEAKTWPQFQEMCLKFQEYWQDRGYPTRHAMDLKQATSDYLVIMLLQRGVNLVDQYEHIHVNDPIVAKTIAFYVQLVAGHGRIGWEGSSNNGVWIEDVKAGNLCAFFTPDWRIFDIQRFGGEDLAGKLRMMPLPRFDPTDAPTSTWGGTMLGITRNSAHHDDAWKLIEFLNLSDAGHAAQLKLTNILPPLVEQWDHPAYHQPDPLFGGQRINEMYVDLARQIPPRYVSPMTVIAQTQLSVVLNWAAKYVEQYGPEGLEAACQTWLNYAASDLKARTENGRFN